MRAGLDLERPLKRKFDIMESFLWVGDVVEVLVVLVEVRVVCNFLDGVVRAVVEELLESLLQCESAGTLRSDAMVSCELECRRWFCREFLLRGDWWTAAAESG